MPPALPRPHRSPDPNKRTRKPLNNGVPTFLFFMIENVDLVDAAYVIAGNDNKLPFSGRREPNQADDYALILLEVGDFLKAQ